MTITDSIVIMECIAGKCDWDNGNWEWEDTPRRDSYSSTGRCHQPSPSPMLIGASPDARLVSPWFDGRSQHSTGNYLYDNAFLLYQTQGHFDDGSSYYCQFCKFEVHNLTLDYCRF